MSEMPRREVLDSNLSGINWLNIADPDVMRTYHAGLRMGEEAAGLIVAGALTYRSEQVSALADVVGSQGEQITDLKIDAMSGVLTRDGLAHELTHNTGLRYELSHPYTLLELGENSETRNEEPRFGLLYLDLRGVKAANELWGTAVGDEFIAAGLGLVKTELAQRTRHAERRTQTTEIEEDRRAETNRRFVTANGDMIVRWGKGDEYIVIVRDTTEEGLAALQERLTQVFSVGVAQDRYEHGEMPVMVGVGRARIGDQQGSKDQMLAIQGDILGAIDALAQRAEEDQNNTKKDQYNAMWGQYYKSLDVAQRLVIEKPADDRKIIEAYWYKFFPDFAANPNDYFQDHEE